VKIDGRRTKDSTMIWGVFWLANTLFVKFNSGGIYRVDEFPYPRFIEMMEAESIGRYYNKTIKGKLGETCVYRKPKAKAEK